MNAFLPALLLAALAADPVPPAPPVPPALPVAAMPALPPAPPAPPAPALKVEAPDAPSAATDRTRHLKGQWSTPSARVTLDLEKVKTREAIKRIAEAAKWGVKFKDSPHGKVDLVLNDVPAEEALLTILKDHNLVADRQGDVITIAEAPEEVVADEDDAERHGLSVGESGDRTQLGGSVKVNEGETVKAAVAIGGDVDVDGTVLQDAVAVGGNVRLGPKAVVKGDVVTVGGTIDADPKATVGRSRVAVGLGDFSKTVLKSKASEKAEESTNWFVRLLKNFARFAAFFVFGLMLLAVAPERIRSIGHELRRTPGLCAAVGLVSSVSLVPLTVLLGVTIVGILLIPFLWLGVAVALLFGFTALALEIGARVPPISSKRTQLAVLGLGTLVVFLLSNVPVLGPLAMFVGTVVVLGAVVRTKMGARAVDANFVPDP